nr:hypothetical protein [Tanacetum cinerariifolium]
MSRLEEQSNDENALEYNNTSSTDGVSPLARGALEVMIFKTLQRSIEPLIVPFLEPLIRRVGRTQLVVALSIQ